MSLIDLKIILRKFFLLIVILKYGIFLKHIISFI